MSETKTAKRQRVDAGEWIDHATDALTQALGKRLTFTDLPADIVKYKIMSLLTVSEAADTFQKGYLVLPPLVSAKHLMMSPSEFFVPKHVIETHLNKTPDPMALIGAWQRSNVGADVRILRFDADCRVRIELKELKALLDCFPKAEALTIATTDHKLDELLSILDDRKTVLRRLHVLDAGYTTLASSRTAIDTAALLPWVGDFQSLHLDAGVWIGNLEHAKALVSNLSKRLESLTLTLRRAPSAEFLQTLFNRCPALVELQLTDAFADTDSVPLKGKFAAALQGDKRLWRRFLYQADEASMEKLSTADLLAITGDQLEALEVPGVDVSEVDFKAVLSKCVKLEVLEVTASPSILEKVYSSPAARNLIRVSKQSSTSIWPLDQVLRYHTQLPRLAEVSTRGPMSKLLETLGQADHFNAMRQLTISGAWADEDQVTTSTHSLAKVILNSTRWTDVVVSPACNITGDPLPVEVLQHLIDKCPDLSTWSVQVSFEGLTGDRLSALMHNMRHGITLNIGQKVGATGDIKVETNDSIEYRHLCVRSHRPKGVRLKNMVLTKLTAEEICKLALRQDTSTDDKSLSFVIPRATAVETRKRLGEADSRRHIAGYAHGALPRDELYHAWV